MKIMNQSGDNLLPYGVPILMGIVLLPSKERSVIRVEKKFF